ncbi:MAG: type I-U CRISPR-associated RAMP protein Csb1/Cas7u, partial [Chloroflexota bacterium]|nr:type I-U CRISPR-associated RAMP protein Csb1/Cas7u [Chloroflexota bacterium]
MPNSLTLEQIKEALAGSAAAFRCVTAYQPAGGPGDKVFPPTYTEGNRQGVYATESRYLDGQEVPCVLLDSVQSQANRMELALLEECETHGVPLPVITVDFTGYNLPKPFRVTSLEAPHRVVDALLRDSEMDGVSFRKSPVGKRLDSVDMKNATALFELCPSALVFGMWDSTGERGGLGVKFQRAMVSEIVGFHAVPGKRTRSRIDPAQILLSAGPLYEAKHGGWTLEEGEAKCEEKGNPVRYARTKEKGESGRPSQANLGNVTPSITPDGGFTISKAIQTTVLSLAALRRLRFPLDGNGTSNSNVDLAARTALAAQALYAAALVREHGADLRSRCLLVPTGSIVWELLDRPGDA